MTNEELNRWCAEKVMGWKCVYSDGSSDWCNSDGRCVRNLYDFDPATDIRDALEVWATANFTSFNHQARGVHIRLFTDGSGAVHRGTSGDFPKDNFEFEWSNLAQSPRQIILALHAAIGSGAK